MKVKELIKELEVLDPEVEVVISEHMMYFDVDKIETIKNEYGIFYLIKSNE